MEKNNNTTIHKKMTVATKDDLVAMETKLTAEIKKSTAKSIWWLVGIVLVSILPMTVSIAGTLISVLIKYIWN